jgi:hypothetical protein
LPLAIFRISQVDGQDTGPLQDPYIHVGYSSQDRVGTSAYANEPVHLIAARRRNGYPFMRWMLLETSRLRLGAILHTERSDFMIASGHLVGTRVISPAEAQILTVTVNVQSAVSVGGGGMWNVLQRQHVTSEGRDDEELVDDLRHLRGRKVAVRAAKWAWDRFF